MDYSVESDLFDRIKKNYKIGSQTMLLGALGAMPHIHNHYEILYCTKGKFNIWIQNKLYTLNVGEFVFINRNEIHQSRPLSGGDNTYTVLQFNTKILSPLIQSTSLNNSFKDFFNSYYIDHFFGNDNPVTPSITAILDKMLLERTKHNLYFDTIIMLNINELFLLLIRNWENTTPNRATHNSAAYDTLNIVNSYIEENYSHKIDMIEVARRCAMSYTSFSRFLFKYTGKNFSSYVNNIRLKYACIQLVTSDNLITEIAMSTGFSSPSYFADYFKKVYGISPQQFRNRFMSSPSEKDMMG